MRGAGDERAPYRLTPPVVEREPPSLSPIWEGVASGQPSQPVGFCDLAFSRDSRHIATVLAENCLVEIRDAATGNVVDAIHGFATPLASDVLSFSDTRLAVGSGQSWHAPGSLDNHGQSQVRLYKTFQMEQLVVLELEHTLELPLYFFKLAFDLTGTLLAVGMKLSKKSVNAQDDDRQRQHQRDRKDRLRHPHQLTPLVQIYEESRSWRNPRNLRVPSF
eukprot:COSAG04_NODE_11315_length_717_cov_0.755663_1_plen_218_part_10